MKRPLALLLPLALCASTLADTGGPAIVFTRKAEQPSTDIKNVIIRRLDPVTLLPIDDPQLRVDRIPFYWEVKGTGDFDGDGNRDLLIQKPNGRFVIRFYDGAFHMLSEHAIAFNLTSTQVYAGVGDMDGDGKDDVFVYDTADGQKVVKAWLMDGYEVVKRIRVVQLNANYIFQGVGDFDGDGVPDVLQMKPNSSTMTFNSPAIQFLQYDSGTGEVSKAQFLKIQPGLSWRLKGVGDVDDDGKADLILEQASLNENQKRPMQVRLMDGAMTKDIRYATPAPPLWHIAGVRF